MGDAYRPSISRRRRLRLAWPVRFDVLVVGCLVAFDLVVLFTIDAHRSGEWLLLLAIVVITSPLLWRSQAPVLALAGVIALQWALLAPIGGLTVGGGLLCMLTVAVGLGAVAARRHVWISLICLCVTYAHTTLVFVVAFPASSAAWNSFATAVVCAVSWGLGAFAHVIRTRLGQLQIDQERAAAAVLAERSRIASELSTIVRGAVAAMVAEASVARVTIADNRGRAVAAFAAVERTGVEAMHELRRLLHLLHDDPQLAVEERTEHADDPVRGRFRDRLTMVSDRDALVTISAIAGTMFLASLSYEGGMRLLASLFLGLTLCVLLWRHQFPVVVFGSVIAATALAVVLFHGGDFVFDNQTPIIPVLVALAAVASATSLWISIPTSLIAWAYLSITAFEYPEVMASNLIGSAAIVIAVWLAGVVTGRRRRQIDRLETAGGAARHAVQQERARLAYELHDVIGHSITVMVLQAAGARRIIEQSPERAAAAIAPIEESGAEAMRELDQLVVMLGEDDATISPDIAADTARIGELDRLVERTRRTVKDIHLEVIGAPKRLEPSVDIAAYCVAREALTNAVKHSGMDAHIVVTVSWMPQLVRVEIASDPGPAFIVPTPELSGGYGLLGLRERVDLAGGELRWSSNGETFTVDARLPVAEPSAPAVHTA
ncbi:histidine kinase [Microbacterium sp. ZW CA_36]|uniref:sensor histidine kinase n=1 Tax=Microbacterium sp. ZW CA_36 TaxID=3378078 RepID=UPI0038531305